MFQIIYKHDKISQPYWMIYIILNYLLNVGVNKLYLLKDKHINILLFTRLYLSFCVLLIIHYMNIVVCNRTKIKNICSRQRLYTEVCYDLDLTTRKLDSRAPYIICLHTACTCCLMVKSEHDWIEGQQIMVLNCTSKIFATV